MDLALDVVTDAARDAAVKAFDTKEIKVESEFGDKSQSDARDMAVDMAVQATTADHEVFQAYLQPAAVEEPLAVEYPGMDRLIVGKVDVRLHDTSICDLKTSKSKKGQNFVDDSQALTTYGLLHLAHYAEVPKQYIINEIVFGKRGIRTEQYVTHRTEIQLQRQLSRFAVALRLIDTGVFMPCSPGDWWCSENFCGFFHQCEFSEAIT